MYINTALLTIAAASLLAIGTSAQDSGNGFITKCVKPGLIALTFDDGPGEATPELLNTLAAAKVKITFFVLGVNSKPKPDILKRIVTDGHEIGVHTWDHKDLNTLTPAQINEEITSTYDLIKQYTGVSTPYFRPPYGNCNAACGEVVKKLNMKVIQWNLDTNDWQWSAKPNPGEVTVKTITDLINKGNPAVDSYIHLQHDIWPYSVKVTGQIIDLLVKKGYKLVSLSECLGGAAAPGPVVSTPANATLSVATSAAPSTLAAPTTAAPGRISTSADPNVNAKSATQASTAPSAAASQPSGAMMSSAPSMLATLTVFSAVLAFLA